MYIYARPIYTNPDIDALYARLEKEKQNNSQPCALLWEENPLYFEDYRLIALRKDNVEKFMECLTKNCTDWITFQKARGGGSTEFFTQTYNNKGIIFNRCNWVDILIPLFETNKFDWNYPTFLNLIPNVQDEKEEL